MNLKFSNHSTKHSEEKWNQITIKRAMDNKQVSGVKFRQGDTSDVMYGYVEDECVGLILSKRKDDGTRVIITGFQADESYWKSV